MSPRTGRPQKVDGKKAVRVGFRLTEDKAEQLRKCAERLQTTRQDIVERGIDMVDEATKEK